MPLIKDYFSFKFLLLPAMLVFFGLSVGCKKGSTASKYKPPTSQLQGGVRDGKHIFLLAPHENWTEEREVYEFIVCRLQRKTSPEQKYINFSTLPHSPRAHMKAFQRKATIEDFLKMLSEEGVNYPTNEVDALLGSELQVLASTCTPAYRGITGKPMALVSAEVEAWQKGAAVMHLKNEAHHARRNQGSYYIASFGVGSAFSAWNNEVLKAFRKIIPSRFHQISLEYLRKIPFVGKIVRFDIGVPWMAQFIVGATAVGQNEPFAIFTSAVDKTNYIAVRPDQKVNPAAEVAAISGSVAVGAISGHLLVSRTARAVARLKPRMGGAWTTVAAGLLLPFLSTIVTNQLNNPAQEALDHFQQILYAIEAPQGVEGEGHIAFSQGVKSSVPEIIWLLGRAMNLGGWSGPLNLHSSCIPADNHQGYSCKLLFDDVEKDSPE